MRIYTDVKIEASRSDVQEKALVDTGSEISIIPSPIARQIGAYLTNQEINVGGVHGDVRTLPVIVADLHFPLLNNIGGQFAFCMRESGEVIIGMDILKPLGITVDTKTNRLLVKNEIWEAFKVLAAIGVLIYGGIKIIEVLSEEKS
jgi:predicted aspartyl protease